MFEFFLNYSADTYAQGEFVFTGDWPLWIPGVILLLAAVAITVLLARRRNSFHPLRLAVIGLLQLSLLALLLVILWQPALRITRLRTGENIVALMLDASSSMTYGKDAGTRLDQARALLADNPALQQIAGEYTVQRYVFTDTAAAVESYDQEPQTGPATRLADSLVGVLQQARTSPLGGVILLSDGGDNSGALSQDQLARIAAFGVPVHTIGIGRERIPEDRELAEVILPDRVLPGTNLSARVVIRHDGGGTARVKVYDGGSFLAAREIPLQEDAAVTSAWIDFALTEPGSRNLRVTIDPESGEVNLRNNTRSHVVDVPEQHFRVLYVEGEPRWEYKFMRRALDDDPVVELVTLLRVSTNKYYRQGIENEQELSAGFPTERADLFRYQALIIGSIEAPVFTLEQQQMMRDFVGERGGSLMLLAGPNGLGDGGWGNSAVSEALPARLPDGGTGFVRSKAKALLTQHGRHAQMLQLSDDAEANDRQWRELPEIADHQFIGELRPAAVRLLDFEVDNERYPLLVSQPYGRGNSYILATGGTWRWQMSLPVEDQRHETFWRQLLRGLVANTEDQFRFSMQQDGDRVSITAEVRDDDYQAQSDVSVTAVVTPEAGETLNVELQPQDGHPGMLSGTFPLSESGLYTIEAIARRGDDLVSTHRMALRHDAGNAEYFSIRQNRTLLESLAAATGGRYWRADDLGHLPEAVSHSEAGISELNILPLWNAPAVFLLLLAIKTAEWLLRRRWNTI